MIYTDGLFVEQAPAGIGFGCIPQVKSAVLLKEETHVTYNLRNSDPNFCTVVCEY